MVSTLFSSLNKYANAQEENFLSESLVFLLNLILEQDIEIGIQLLNNICGTVEGSWFLYQDQINIYTQQTIVEGRPDIIITDGNEGIVFIEVKHDACLGEIQLERYFAHLENSDYQNKQLVLLTRSRSSIQETTISKEQFHHICWYQIAGWLSDIKTLNEVIQFMIENFLYFLKEKEMSMEKVTWEFIQGVPAMVNLANMLGTAISEAYPERNMKRSAGANWNGYYLDDDYFIGFRYDMPLVLVFENNKGTRPSVKYDLFLEKAHYFSLSAGEQLETLINFVAESGEKTIIE
jgi:hypothetical protein